MTKKLNIDNNNEEICSVSAMAQKLKLSRARFYQLLQQGVFPPPVYCVRTRRPLYPRDIQEQCLRIRRAGITAAGQPIFFYAPRVKKSKACQHRSHRSSRVLTDALEKMGLKVTLRQFKRAIGTVYPEGLPETEDMGPVISNLFRHLREEVSK